MQDNHSTFLDFWKARARALKKEVYALYFAYRDPRTPWPGKVLAALIVAYAFSPIDLIPDPIPILGYLDDLILVPLGIVIVLKMIPPDVLSEARAKAEESLNSDKPVSWAGALIIGAIWLAGAVAAVWLIVHLFS